MAVSTSPNSDSPRDAGDLYRLEGYRRISVRAVVAGAAIAAISQVILMVLGAAIGLTAFKPEEDVAKGVGIGYAAWLIVSLTASSFIGAWVAGYVARTSDRRDGVMNGLVAWAVVSLAGLFFVGGTVANLTKGALGVAGEAVKTAAQSPALARGIEDANARRDNGADDVREDVERTIEDARYRMQDPATREEMKQKTEDAAEGAALGMWGLLIAHLLPLGAALLGGAAGARADARAGFTPAA